MKDHKPLDPMVLDMMYEHPHRFMHMTRDEYMRLLIDDIRYYRTQLGLPAESPMTAAHRKADGE